MEQPALKKLIRKGWLDYALFDGNTKDTRIQLRISGEVIPLGNPLVVIANYVLDSLLTDAWRLTPGGKAERALISLYSTEDNPDITKTDIMNRISLGWAWETVDLSLLEESMPLSDEAALHVSPSEYLCVDKHILSVIKKYKNLEQPMSFVLPVGAFSLFQTLLKVSGYSLFCLVGDKGYPSYEEFIGHRDPHIAIHGSISFMVNLDAIRSYFDCIGGFSMATLWKDCFQITGLWYTARTPPLPPCLATLPPAPSSSSSSSSAGIDTASLSTYLLSKEENRLEDYTETLFPESSSLLSNRQKWQFAVGNFCSHSTTAFYEDVISLVPDALIMWQRTAADALSCNSGFTIKQLLPLLRFSGHDAELFWNFRNMFAQQCVAPFINPRTEEDLLIDLHKVYKNWYKIRNDENVSEVCAYVCMKIGKCDKALYYFEKSLKYAAEDITHATYANMASCYKAIKNYSKAMEYCEKAIEIFPNFQMVKELMITLSFCMHPIRLALIGCGQWTRYEAIHLLKNDKRCKIVALFSFNTLEMESLAVTHDLSDAEQYSKKFGLQTLLKRKDISACVVDLHFSIMNSMLSKIWESGKHVLTRIPHSFSLQEAKLLVHMYTKQYCHILAWQCVDNYRLEEAFHEARKLFPKIGVVKAFSFHFVTDTIYQEYYRSTSPFTSKEYLILELLRCLRAVNTTLCLSVQAISATFTDSSTHPLKLSSLETSPQKSSKEIFSSTSSSPPILEEAALNDAPTLSGWSHFGDKLQPTTSTIAGSFLLTHKGGDNAINYRFFGSHGMMEIKKSTSVWQIIITPSATPFQVETIAIQSIGHQNNHDAWLQQIYQKSNTITMTETEERKGWETSITVEDFPVLKNPSEASAWVDISISEAFVDSAIAEGVVSSIERNGCMAMFGYTPQ
ncbi:tetratricopeptide repeat-containing protein [Cardiosporidium cionae]|uniref:Tetratricopeptide repeat-containing protein n=1 Tax=Cardiosporidium cionae TaxID=476202 RepID=A0ABQ7JFE9_9APIC|nr:tetratricopeptide repeat-containing protein [Cardiosporidium cionae]|eukprot:KAF8822718.1 tetratricopeptide repeat-containing protein [Cardiosporidium cionae]